MTTTTALNRSELIEKSAKTLDLAALEPDMDKRESLIRIAQGYLNVAYCLDVIPVA